MDNIVTTVGDGNSLAGRGNLTQSEGGSLDAPETLIPNATIARTYYRNYRTNHIDRIRLYAAIEGLIAGNPPYDTAKLAAAGLNHIANVNTLDAKGLYEKAALTFWNLINQTEHLVKFEISPFQTKQDQDYSGWAQILSKNWTKVIREDWEDFVPQVNMLTGQLVKFGLSPVIFPDEQDFRWKTVDISRFFIADNLPTTPSEWDYICVETSFTVQYLYKVYKELKDNTENPWKKAALEDYLVRRANYAQKRNASTEFDNFLALQTSLQNGSTSTANVFGDSVRLVSMLYKEYTGEISHCIFDPVADGTSDFLFQVINQYKSFQEGIVVFTYSPGEMYLHGNRGVGHKIYPVCQALMQLDCNMLDMSKMSATPVISTTTNGVGRDISPIRFIPGVATDIGTAKLEQNQLGANVGQLVTVAQYMEQKVNRNAIVSGDDPSTPDADRGSKSAPEAQMQSIREFGVGKQNVAHFYNTDDVVIRQMTIKMLHAKEGYACYPLVKKWKDKCIQEGVPKEVFDVGAVESHELPLHLSVKASRVAGDGSNLGLIMGLNGVAGIAGGFGAKGQYNYRKDIIASRLGSDYVDRYLSDSQEPDEAAGGASLAQLENIAIKGGEMPQTTQDNQHKSHIGSHMALITSVIQAVQAQKMDPIEADKILSLALPHTGEHIQFVQQDSLNRGFIEQIKGPWTQITKFAQLNRVKAQKMMQAEVRRRDQEEQKLDAAALEQQRKDMVAEREQNRKDFESEKKQERATAQSQTTAEIKKAAVEKTAENERLAVNLKADNERAKVVQKPEKILEGTSTEQLQSTLESQVGNTPNPADFK